MRFLWALLVLVLVPLVAAEDVVFTDGCHTGSILAVHVGFGQNTSPYVVNGSLSISNDCVDAGGNEIDWVDPVTLELGDIQDGDVIIQRTSIYVDSVTRPDLDQPATLTFRNVPFAVEPGIYKDGVECLDCSNTTFDSYTRTYSTVVTGFSNYSLQALQEFSVYSDDEPELSKRVYQTIDLGDANRATEFRCLVQIYGLNDAGQFVLIQTNPEREVAARLFGSPDTNNPESLGYFKTENGLANVYFNGEVLAGYTDAEYVVMCASNSTKLIYEEPISTRYSPAGRSLAGRGVWLTSGNNAFYMIISVVGLFILFFLALRFVRVARGR